MNGQLHASAALPSHPALN